MTDVVKFPRRKKPVPPRFDIHRPPAPPLLDGLLDEKTRVRAASDVVRRCRHFAADGDRKACWRGILDRVKADLAAEGGDAELVALAIRRFVDDVAAENQRITDELQEAIARPLSRRGAKPRAKAEIVQFPGKLATTGGRANGA